MSFKMTGFKELEKYLEKIEKEVEKVLGGEFDISEMFDDEFMKENTQLNTIYEFIEGCPIDFKNIEGLDALEDPDMDKYVSEVTDFKDWQSFKESAKNKYAAKKLKAAGFKLG